MALYWHEGLPQHPRLRSIQQRPREAARMWELLDGCARAERLSAPELAARQRQHLVVVATHAAAESAHFAGRLASAGLVPADLGVPEGLPRLPSLKRAELMAAGEAFFCRRHPESHGGIGTATTSGSTGQPVTIRRTEWAQEHWLAHTLREHLWHQRDFAGRLAIIRANRPGPVETPDWGPPARWLFHTGASSLRPTRNSLEQLMAWLMQFQPTYLLVPPSTWAGLLEVLEKVPGRLQGLQQVRTLSETVSERLRAETRRVCGVEIADIYSSQEMGIMAAQCPEGGGYHVTETIVMEVVDAAGQPCGPGQVGRILVTDLLNYVSPLIRYEIGDYAEVGVPCSCGRGLPVIRRFLGRERNLVLLPDGTRHWATVKFSTWKEIYPIRQFQFTQLDRQVIEARFVAQGRPTPDQEAALVGQIQSGLGYPFEIRVFWQETPLPVGPGGKFEEFLCKAK